MNTGTDLDKDETLKRDIYLGNIRKVLATNEGVEFFKGFFDRGRIFQTSFTGNSWTHFYEGKRSFALEIMQDLIDAEVNPDIITKLLSRREDGSKY